MKSDVRIVNARIRRMTKSKLRFVEVDYFDDRPEDDQTRVEREVKNLKELINFEHIDLQN